jgi:hypothetical protein
MWHKELREAAVLTGLNLGPQEYEQEFHPLDLDV